MESIGRFVADQLAAWEVPGCAIAAVRDGEVVLAAGWGRRDVATGLPVTPDTLFAIGSVTKAFTAATVGALVDGGLLEWDRPLRDYLQPRLPGGGAHRGGALRDPMGGLPADQAAHAAEHGPLQRLGR
jgi:CubicO group peptidase (beta-lactamase class C family)